MSGGVAQRIEAAIGRRVERLAPLHGGCVAQVYRAELEARDAGTPVVVAKVAEDDAGRLSIEGAMLDYLREHSRLPAPRVLHASDRLLVMEFVEGDSRFDADAERHAADLLADLHSLAPPAPPPPHATDFGFERDTLIGGLPQPNGWMGRWTDFFRERRLLHMADEAARAGRLPATVQQRIVRLAARLSELIDEPPTPSLLHGDVWTGNVLARRGCVTAFLDPAVYYGHPEVELAFITLFGTFGPTFFDRYTQHRPIAPGFFESRRTVYNLYPLLVHTRLFGGGYAESVSASLSRLGF